MEKQEIKAFFNEHAQGWDAEMETDEAVLSLILDSAGVREGARVLDIACGTGVLVPYYLSRGVSSVTGVDFSPEMIRLAREKFAGEARVRFVCADCDNPPKNWIGRCLFDCVVIYNALPHFVDPDHLIENLSSCLAPGGRISVAHGMSREALEAHHSGSAASVSMRLPSVSELSLLFRRCGLSVVTRVSDKRMFQVTGQR